MDNTLKTQITLVLLLILPALNATTYAEVTKKRVLWENRPIPVFINVNEERIIHFPTDIRYWMPDYLTNKVSALSANGVLYITAHEPIKKTRIRVQALDTQKVYLIDVMAEEVKRATPELIIMDKAYTRDEENEKGVSTVAKAKRADWYVRLIRFAAQSLYADEHLMPSDGEITRAKVDRVNPVPLVRGGDIEAIPVASWQGGGFYVTAVRLRNLSDKNIPIVYDRAATSPPGERVIALHDDIRGRWLAASVQHSYVAASGHQDREDITSLYLISTRTFKESF